MEKVTASSLPARILALIVATILILLPVHAVLTVGLSEIVGHYMLLRLWKEFLLGVALAAVVWILWESPKLRDELKASVLIRVSAMYVSVVVLWAAVALIFSTATPKAVGYGLISDGRFVIFMIVCLIAARTSVWLYRKRYILALGPAGVVVGFGLLQQYVLPADVLRHVGYGPDTVRPFQRIDKKDEYVRIISTMRGANPLGAYLVVILSLVATLIRRQITLIAVAMIAVLSVLFASHSRSAWLGMIVVFVVLVAVMIPRRYIKSVVLAALVSAMLCVTAVYAARDNNFVQNTLFHTDETSQSVSSSNDARQGAIMHGVQDVIREPWGRGVGTAGPASVHNTGHEGRLAENYYLQIGQETGLIGLIAFIALQGIVALELVRSYKRQKDVFALGLFAAFLGLVVVNVLNHAWADDTLAYVFWGLAGIVLSHNKMLAWSEIRRDTKVN